MNLATTNAPSRLGTWRRFLLFLFLAWSYSGPQVLGFHVWYTAAFPAHWILVGTTGPDEKFFDVTGNCGFYTVSAFNSTEETFAL